MMIAVNRQVSKSPTYKRRNPLIMNSHPCWPLSYTYQLKHLELVSIPSIFILIILSQFVDQIWLVLAPSVVACQLDWVFS